MFANHVLDLLVKFFLDLWMSGKVIEQEVFPVVSIPAVIASMAITAGIWESGPALLIIFPSTLIPSFSSEEF